MERTWAVYCITCLDDGRLYIGVTSRSVTKRWQNHWGTARSKSPAQGPLQIAMRKLGQEAFSVRTLHEGLNQSEAMAAERRLIAELNTLWPNGYNGTTGGDIGLTLSPDALARMTTALRGKKRSAATRARMSEAAKRIPPETRAKMRAAQTGLKRTPEQIERMRVASFKKNTEEVKAKIRATLKGRLTRSAEANARATAARIGQKRSAETRAKMSASQLLRFARERGQTNS